MDSLVEQFFFSYTDFLREGLKKEKKIFFFQRKTFDESKLKSSKFENSKLKSIFPPVLQDLFMHMKGEPMAGKENREIKNSVFVDLFYEDESAEANEIALF